MFWTFWKSHLRIMMTLCDINLPVLVDDEIGKTLHINILIKTRNFLKYQEAFLRKFLLFLSFILLYFWFISDMKARDLIAFSIFSFLRFISLSSYIDIRLIYSFKLKNSKIILKDSSYTKLKTSRDLAIEKKSIFFLALRLDFLVNSRNYQQSVTLFFLLSFISIHYIFK